MLALRRVLRSTVPRAVGMRVVRGHLIAIMASRKLAVLYSLPGRYEISITDI